MPPPFAQAWKGRFPPPRTDGCGSWRHAPYRRTSPSLRRQPTHSSRTPYGSRRTGAPWCYGKGLPSSATGPTPAAGDFFEFGALHSRTVYLDALLLGSLQRDHIDELTDELSEVFNSSRLARRVATLERNIAVFRSTYWRQHLTAHGAANDLLLAFQNQHRLPARFNEILAEAADYSRLVQTQESQQISGALGVLTILGLPLGTALGILQVLDDHSMAHLLIALGLSVAAAAAVLTTRYGRLVLSSLRGGDRRA